MKRTMFWIVISGFVCLVLAAGMGDVIARPAQSLFAGRILILTKKPPTELRAKAGFVSFLRKHQTRVVKQNSKKGWTFQTMSFLKKPLGDFEVHLAFYNIENGRSADKKEFVDIVIQHTLDRYTQRISGKARLMRPTFDSNTRYQVVAKSRGQELASGEFTTVGVPQAVMDEQNRFDQLQKEMEEQAKALEQAAKAQEEREKEDKANQEAADGLF